MNNIPSIHRNRLAAALLGLGLFLAVFSTGQANTYYIYNIDTSAYAGQTGHIAFDLFDGDGVVDNTLSVANLTVTGGSLTGSSNFNLADTAFFNEVLLGVVYGSNLSFSFQLTQNFAGGTPDSFGFYVLDNTNPPFYLPLFSTSDPQLTDAAFAVDITDAAGGSAGVYAGNLAVPEQGSSLALGGLAFGLLAFVRRFIARRAIA
jgi:hypothetical protein